MSIISARIVGENVSYDTYARQGEGISRGHKDFSMSRGELVNFASNPKRWLDGYKDEDEETPATVFGSLIECLAGLNGVFEERYAVAPAEYADEKTGKMKPWTFAANVCKAWREEQGEREVIKADLLERANQAVAALRNDPDVNSLFECSKKQVMVLGIWKDMVTKFQIPIRCLIDLVPDREHPNPTIRKALADFKTARNGCPDLWPRVVEDSGYDVQAALSLDLYVTATKEDRRDWIFPVSENVHPYHVVSPMPALTAEFLAYGRAKYEAALKLYAQCLATNHWPSYSTGNRLVMGPVQLIGPDTLWKYRESGGNVASREYEPEPPRPAPEEKQFDVPH